MTIVRVTSGGIPVTESDRGIPYYDSDNGFGIPVTFVSQGGAPLVGVIFGPPPQNAPANAKPLIGADGAPLRGADGAQLWST